MRSAVRRISSTRCMPIVLHQLGPSTSASSPFALRRNMSICHNRSCAVTYPCAKNRSSCVAASICGTPCASRRTVTAADKSRRRAVRHPSAAERLRSACRPTATPRHRPAPSAPAEQQALRHVSARERPRPREPAAFDHARSSAVWSFSQSWISYRIPLTPALDDPRAS